MAPELTTILTIADKVGVIACGVGFFWALYTKRLVFGWIHDECSTELKKFREEANARLTRLENEMTERHRGER